MFSSSLTQNVVPIQMRDQFILDEFSSKHFELRVLNQETWLDLRISKETRIWHYFLLKIWYTTWFINVVALAVSSYSRNTVTFFHTKGHPIKHIPGSAQSLFTVLSKFVLSTVPHDFLISHGQINIIQNFEVNVTK